MSKSMAPFTVVSLCLAGLASAIWIHGHDIDAPLRDSYDYIVVGCGISGLVVTNRLSEEKSVTVLCIEAGIADHYEPVIQEPMHVGADIGGVYDWKLATVPQSQLDGATRPMPQGKVLGGGSILNAMCWNRGGKDDYDAWEALGNPGWGWEGMLPYFMKSETYTPVYSEEIARQYSINYNPQMHGTSGPVQVSYPKYFYPQSANFFDALNYLGVPTEFDPNDGSSAGAAFVPTDIDPNNQTRSDARRAYFDPYTDRENFQVVTGQHVTRILIDGVADNQASGPMSGGNSDGDGYASSNTDGFGFSPIETSSPVGNQENSRRRDFIEANLKITGVEFAPNASAPRQKVYATKEVIVAAGALHSAQLLQLSGIGPGALLKSFDIPVAIDLPGVGNNLQDHCLVGTFYPYNNDSYPSPTELTTNATYNAEAEQEYRQHKTGPWTAGSPNALAFPPLPLISNKSDTILTNADGQYPEEFLVAGLDPSIVAGYALQKNSLVRRLRLDTVAAYEIINNNAGSLTVSVMHPFSRGTCTINSADPFEPPIIDPRWLSNPIDRQILIEALLFNREILASPSMIELQAAQFVPSIEADEDTLNRVINHGIRTEFHPSGTCAMLPREQGGVVDAHLRVWGTQNLRVVDAGIFPLVPAAHLQAVVYGVAEKAADIIKADNSKEHPTKVSSSSSETTPRSTLTSVQVRLSLPLSTQTPSPILKATSPLIETSMRIFDTEEASPAVKTSTRIINSEEASTAVTTSAAYSTTENPFIIDHSEMSSSVVNVLTSILMPQPAVDSLVPVILGSAPTPISTTQSSESTPGTMEAEIQQQRAAISDFLTWLLSFFNVH